jgi:hypothetical protein
VATNTNWNNRYVLRRSDERDATHHRIYKYANTSGEITSADNYFASAPFLVPKAQYRVVSIVPPRRWQVSLESQRGSVEMSVYQLKRLS